MAAPNDPKSSGQALHDLFREVFALQAALAGVMDRVHAEAGLSTPQHRIMRALAKAESATVPDLAAQLGVSRQFVQTVCNELAARNYLTFRANPRHKRSKLTALTEAGRAAFRLARQKENALIERTLPGIDAAKAAEAGRLLQGIREAVDHLIDEMRISRSESVLRETAGIFFLTPQKKPE